MLKEEEWGRSVYSAFHEEGREEVHEVRGGGGVKGVEGLQVSIQRKGGWEPTTSQCFGV